MIDQTPESRIAWKEFVRTGSMEAYMRYREINERRE